MEAPAIAASAYTVVEVLYTIHVVVDRRAACATLLAQECAYPLLSQLVEVAYGLLIAGLCIHQLSRWQHADQASTEGACTVP